MTLSAILSSMAKEAGGQWDGRAESETWASPAVLEMRHNETENLHSRTHSPIISPNSAGCTSWFVFFQGLCKYLPTLPFVDNVTIPVKWTCGAAGDQQAHVKSVSTSQV